MKKEQAIVLSHFIEKYDQMNYVISNLDIVNGTLPKFHQWTNCKKVVAGYKVTRLDTDTSYFLIFIDWHRNDNYYLVIYTHDKSTTVAEIRQIEELAEGPHLVWKYNPLKRDGKNDQRKAFFKQTFGSLLVEISLPKSAFEIERFFTRLFQLCSNRIKADKIVDVFDFEGR
jgi:hypothetical protein